MSELGKLREEQRKKWLEETRIKDELETKVKRKEQELNEEKRKEEKRKKEERDHWQHEYLHAEIAAQADTVDEANLLLAAHQADVDFRLQSFREGSLSFYKSKRIQDKYGIVRLADETKTETLLTSSLHQQNDDALLQMAIHASLAHQ